MLKLYDNEKTKRTPPEPKVLDSLASQNARLKASLYLFGVYHLQITKSCHQHQ